MAGANISLPPGRIKHAPALARDVRTRLPALLPEVIFGPRSGPAAGPDPGPRQPRPGGDVRRETHRLRTDDGELHVRLRGRGPRVLMLHGLTAHGGAWTATADRLAERFTLVMPDLLSRGRSEPRPDLPHDLASELRRVRTLARATGTAGRPVVGHSHGAALAAGLASGPGRPAGLVLVCPVTRGPLVYDSERGELVSRGANLAFPIHNGIPIMLVDEARPLEE